MKWLAPALAYLAVGLGIFVFHSAWRALIGFHLAILGSLLIARPTIPLSTLCRHTRLRWTLLSILLCGSSGVALYLRWDTFGFAQDLPQQIRALGLTGRTWPLFIAYFALVNPFVEEYFWRGWLGSENASVHVSDLLYAGFHGLILLNKVQAGTTLFALAVLALAGWFWRQLARADHGLLATVLGHMAADLTILLAVFLQVRNV